MNSLLKYASWGLVVIFVLGFVFYLNLSRNLFAPPQRRLLEIKCDALGKRRVDVYEIEGNAITTTSIHVEVNYCLDRSANKFGNEIFIAEAKSIDKNDVEIDFVSFDTLGIRYNRDLRIFKKQNHVAFSDSLLNLHVVYGELK